MSVALFAYLSYRDATGGVAWLEAVGFERVRVQAEGDRVLHAELRMGSAVVMVASDQEGYETPALRGQSTGGGLYLLVEAVEPIFERAIAAGGIGVIDPESTEWGSRRARVLDPDGHEWSFGTYEPGRVWV